MYHRLYNLGIRTYGLALQTASLFNEKAKDWRLGRKNLFRKLEENIGDDEEILWFHAASLGEAEQGLPVMQQLKAVYPHKKILLSFFSPSGMQHFKHREVADHIFYLPLDTPYNARRFVEIAKPQLAFFIKYEIWPNFFHEILERKIPLVIAPAVFRPEQFYFKNPHKSFFLPLLRKCSSIMVQDDRSQHILHQHKVESQVVGDSRFDRVLQNTQAPFEDEVLEKFSAGSFTLIGGSTWEPEEKILRQALKKFPEVNLILAPHNIKKENIDRLEKFFGDISFRYSAKPDQPQNFRVCLIDNIGMLSRLYRFGQAAFIGGAFGSGIHNSLEAVAYGMPVFFGPKHHNFVEPAEMLEDGFAFETSKASEFQEQLKPLLDKPEYLTEVSDAARNYVMQKAGSVEKIVAEVRKLLRD